MIKLLNIYVCLYMQANNIKNRVFITAFLYLSLKFILRMSVFIAAIMLKELTQYTQMRH